MKKKKLSKNDPNWSSVTMRINEQSFHAEGDKDEVQAKFQGWLDKTLAPIGQLARAAQKAIAGHEN